MILPWLLVPSWGLPILPSLLPNVYPPRPVGCVSTLVCGQPEWLSGSKEENSNKNVAKVYQMIRHTCLPGTTLSIQKCSKTTYQTCNKNIANMWQTSNKNVAN